MNLTRRKTLTKICLLSLTMPNLSRAATAAPLSPEILIINAAIHTLDQTRPTASALAIVGDRIAAVGSTTEIRALAGPKTRFIDAHVHFLTGGYSLSEVDLRDAKSPEELATRLGAYARKLPKGRWILRGDWDHEKWPGSPLPSKETIDAATPDHPVFVSRLDGHMGLANSLALKLAGITKDTKEPPGGVIVRDPKTGDPTGILKDAAEGLIQRVIPEKSFDEKHLAARAATDFAAKMGVTSVTDMSAGEDVGV